MKLKMILRSVLATWLLIGITQAFANSGPAAEQGLSPEPDFSDTSVKIIEYLKLGHYQRLELDDRLSSKMLDEYLLYLDKSRSHFTQSDVREFEVYRQRLDDDLKNGNLDAAYSIFNRYTQRMQEQVNYMLARLDKGLESFDFEQFESMEVDREHEPWPADIKELEDLWRKQLKNAILLLRLSDKTDPEITEKLKSRYQNQIKQLRQFKSNDVFQVYMNTFTGLYDPHTQYFSPRTSENFNINMKLSLEGIGAVLQSEDEYTKVLRLVPAGPADNGGQLKPTDLIIGVGQGETGEIIDVVGWRLDDVVDLIRGPKGSVVRLEIIPGGDAKADTAARIVNITRDTVRLEEQSAKKDILEIKTNGKKPRRIGIIDIPAFYMDYRAQQVGDPNFKSTTRDVRDLLGQLNQEGIDGLIVDLRNNGGGSLSEAITLTGLFIETGPTVQIRNANGSVRVLEDRDPTYAYSGPLVVLVNRLSASASEIFAGAIQDYQRGVVIGSQTFGKGTVQSLQPLDQGQLKLTQSKFYRISGASTQNRGVVPDILLPSLFDSTEIGESTMPNALPWDTISTVSYPKYGNINQWLGELQKRHELRSNGSSEFDYLLQKKKLQDEMKQKSKLSLNESIRKMERSQSDSTLLKLENKRRAAAGEKELKDLAELEEKPLDENTNEIDRRDPLLKEGAQILIDYINLSVPAMAVK
ncbi:MAG: carboxy terminal-processing peptidase [Methylococcaceae bacterium]|nr:carboxy terminal-processing peptidase [Methylococcaceae bacterium]